MLSAADTPVEDAIRAFADYGFAAAYFVPTETGLRKSIIDAHEGIRSYLSSRGIHDYATQAQGQDHKKVLEVTVVGSGAYSTAAMSLYRPETKAGDPRLWVRGLPSLAAPWNLVALIADDRQRLFLVNCSDRAVMNSISDPQSPLGLLVRSRPRNDVAEELLGKLRAIEDQGFVQSLRDGPTGVGFTLETLLGIEANTRRTPDYKGIELKSTRHKESSQLQTLFSKSPD